MTNFINKRVRCKTSKWEGVVVSPIFDDHVIVRYDRRADGEECGFWDAERPQDLEVLTTLEDYIEQGGQS